MRFYTEEENKELRAISIMSKTEKLKATEEFAKRTGRNLHTVRTKMHHLKHGKTKTKSIGVTSFQIKTNRIELPYKSISIEEGKLIFHL